LTVNAQTLEHEPALHAERGNLPKRVSAAQLTTLYRRFGARPYWTQTSESSGKLAQPKN
jgi:hypothetical protein